jgi:quinol monooxygenase YgiN
MCQPCVTGPAARRVDAGENASLPLREMHNATGGRFMRLFFRLVALGVAIVAATAVRSADAQDSAVYLATYVDVMPNSIATGATLLKQYRAASLKADGNLRFDVVQEIGRPNRFAIVEAWRDKAALDAHAQTAAAQQFRDKLKAIQNAPYDERDNTGLYIAQGKSEQQAGAIFVLTHIDVLPAGKDQTMAALKDMSVDTTKEPGNISYEVLQQFNRANHFTVFEEWTSMKGVEAHAMTEHTRSLREKLSPLAGALYDERFYKALS